MPVPFARSKSKDVPALLEQLRDQPIGTDEPESDGYLVQIYNYLKDVPEEPKTNMLHWFCDKASPVTVNAASFLMRLLAYSSPEVETWKDKFRLCVSSCPNCVKYMQDAKVSSRSTFFGKFPDSVMKGFYQTFDSWEVEIVLSNIKKVPASRSLDNAPSATVYHILSSPAIFRHSEVLSLFRSRCPTTIFQDWPMEVPPPGLYALIVDDSLDIRNWGQKQSLRCTNVPLKVSQLNGSSKDEIQKALVGLSNEADLSNSLTVSSQPSEAFKACFHILRILPPEMLYAKSPGEFDLRRVIWGHLPDVGPHFSFVIRSFILVLKRLKTNVWQGEESELPHVIFEYIKENPSFSELLLKAESSTERGRLIGWFDDYLHAITDPAAFDEVLKKMVDFMCGELQHERFADARPGILCAAWKLLLNASRWAQTSQQKTSIADVIDIQADLLAAVAFDLSYAQEKWSLARIAARELLAFTLGNDIGNIAKTVATVCELLSGLDVIPSAPSIRIRLWQQTYTSLQPNDSGGAALIIKIFSRAAHIDVMKNESAKMSVEIAKKLNQEIVQRAGSCQNTVRSLNKLLIAIREGFKDALSNFANQSSSDSVAEVLRKDGIVQDVIRLMLSPIEEVQTSTQALIGVAYDADVRAECFRALFENKPDAAMAGLLASLSTFKGFAPAMPEACNLSKSVVRCLTDILEALCVGQDGLLHSKTFLRPEDKNGPGSSLMKMWNLMAFCISTIFKRTPSWARFFDSEEMILWMRDALIFGREMLAHRQAIEVAAASVVSDVRKVRIAMMEDLQGVVPELVRWLRLTDEELLHQSVSLLQSLLDIFREFKIHPTGLAKLQEHIDKARNPDAKAPVSRLDAARMLALEAAIASFNEKESDDEVEFISESVQPPQAKQKIKAEEKKPKAEDKKPKAEHKKLKVEEKKPKKEFIQVVNVTKSSSSATKADGAVPKSRFFTDKDQSKLDAANAATSAPTFKRKSKPSTSRITDGRSVTASASSGASSAAESDDSSSSDDDDAESGGLAALENLQRPKKPFIKKAEPQPRRRVLPMDFNGNVIQAPNPILERIKRQEEARRMEMRLRPDIGFLIQSLLSWNYNMDTLPIPRSSLTRIPETFRDYKHYRSVMEPLLLLECWAQLMQSKAEEQEVYSFKISSRSHIDDWLDLDATLNGEARLGWYLNDSHVVLLKQGDRSILAKVQNYKVGKPTPVEPIPSVVVTLRCTCKGGSDPGLQIGSVWQLNQVLSLSTLQREYAALAGLAYYDILNLIFNAKLSPKHMVSPAERDRVMRTHGVNEPQANAIVSALKTDGISLIQGPPGTGKTSTICGLIDAFLASRAAPAVPINVGANAVKPPVLKALICAPSNAAIDEVALRVKEGSRYAKRNYTPKVVRIGADKAISSTVQDISLEFLVDQKMGLEGFSNSSNVSNEINLLRDQINEIKKERQTKQEELSRSTGNPAKHLSLEGDIRQLNARRQDLIQRMDRLRDQQKSEFRSQDAARRKFRRVVLDEADVICSTLSSAGRENIEDYEFDMLVIDEAAQAIELSALIPLKYKCKRCVMVGDPKQLPPTVISEEAKRFGYDQSLFVRLYNQNPESRHLLSIQYRMHPVISQGPSRLFYGGMLLDGPEMDVKTKQDWHSHPLLGIYKFFNVRGQEEVNRTKSRKNVTECRVAMAIYARLRQEFKGFDYELSVGVVTPYAAQVGEMKRQFATRFGNDIKDKVQIQSVDGFQGQEKDVIIFSCVRAGPSLESIGHLADDRRMNVALTRAKSSLYIIGDVPTLQRSKTRWSEIIDDARERGLLIDADANYFTKPVTAFTKTAAPISKKVQKPTNNAIPAVPDGLVTPQQLKAQTPNRRASLTGPATTPTASVPDPEPINATNTTNALKRRAEESDQIPPQPSASTSNPVPSGSDGPRPPAKRPKKPQTMFLPSKPRR